MTRSSFHLLLGAGLLLTACGDDEGTASSNSATEGVTNASATGTAGDTATTTGVSGEPTSEPTSGVSASMSSTDDPATSTTTSASEGSSGEPGESTGNINPETTTDGTTTDEGTTTGAQTTAETTTGEQTTADPDVCPLGAQHLPCDGASDDALHAIGLNCTTAGPDWVANQNAVAVDKLNFMAPPAAGGRRTWQVAKSYGTHVDPNTNKPFWGPREGEKVLLISTGTMPAPNGQGAVVLADSDVYNDAAGGAWDSDTMPPPMSPSKGSPDPMGFTTCDGVNDCSNTIEDQWDLGGADANDKMWFSFEIKAPALADGDIADANGYTFDFAYFSAEFPEFVDSTFNDIFVVWQDSEDYTGNVTFINGQPLTVTALWPVDFDGTAPELEGTGFVDDFFFDAGATGWYKATGGVKPGETFVLAFAIFDMGDSDYDTTAILDNWQWDCVGCVPNEVNSCGIEPQ